MVFSSLLFLFRFLPAVLLAYFIAPRGGRNLVLLLFSLLFYAWGEPVYILLMLVSILIAYAGGLSIDRCRHLGRARAAKGILFLSSAASLSLLLFFKYADFAFEAANSLLGTSFASPRLALPIGISFYTFQTLSYLADVYRGEVSAQRDPIAFGAYVAMFPQLIAGPIVQYKAVGGQLRARKETARQFALGVHRFMIGLGKKVLLANSAGALWSTIQAMNPSATPALTAWLGLIAYAFQIYFDFSGYSDMAIGLGHMFGFRFPENFDHPYCAQSITDFWRRWHISLGAWFREYVYIPLGGNRAGMGRHVRNILVVWLLTGLWHGASWNFVLWGLYYGVLLLLEKFVFGKSLGRLPPVCGRLYCMFFVLLGWNLFAFDDLTQGAAFFKALFGLWGQGAANGESLYLLYNHMALLLLCAVGSTALPQRAGRRIAERLEGSAPLLSLLLNAFYLFIFILCVAWLVDATYNPFLYFRF